MKNKIYIIHENDEWVEPLRKELQDINTNTNYNSQAEKKSEIKEMKSIAKFLKEELFLLNNIKAVA